MDIEAQRELDVAGPQMQVGQAVDGNLYLGGIIVMNLGAHGYLAMSLKSKNGVG